MINLRTDLALEAREIYSDGKKDVEIGGVTFYKEEINDIAVTTVEITNEEGMKNLNKPIGRYITLESQRIKSMDPEFSKEISYVLKNQLEKIIKLEKNDTVLVVGLGNWNITPDALGPKVISEIMVTKHLKDYMPEHMDDDIRAVSAISPGVLGITGVETSDIISGIVRKIKPSLVIAIDALASKSPERISSTIQITDTGINPGSGRGNKRAGLNSDTLKVPVVAIGVPTVVDALSIAAELTNRLFTKILENSDENSEVYSVIKTLRENGEENLIRQVIEDEKRELMVTPKEVDNLISHISTVIANGINLALHKNIDLEYIESFTF